MTLPDDWWAPSNLEDEPCDGCGTRPSKHAGHGSFICQKCHEGRWCPKCHYAIRPIPPSTEHVCPTPEEIVIRKRKMKALDLASFDQAEEIEALLVERDTLKGLLQRIEDEQAELNLRCLVCGEDQHAADCDLLEAITSSTSSPPKSEIAPSKKPSSPEAEVACEPRDHEDRDDDSSGRPASVAEAFVSPGSAAESQDEQDDANDEQHVGS